VQWWSLGWRRRSVAAGVPRRRQQPAPLQLERTHRGCRCGPLVGLLMMALGAVGPCRGGLFVSAARFGWTALAVGAAGTLAIGRKADAAHRLP